MFVTEGEDWWTGGRYPAKFTLSIMCSCLFVLGLSHLMCFGQ